MRLDRLEHAASLVSRLARTGSFLAPRELPAILGCPPAELSALLSAMGYSEREGRFERRPRPARHAAARGAAKAR